MKTRILFVLLALFAVAQPGLQAQPKPDESAPATPAAPAAPHKKKEEDTELEKKMERLDKAWKKLGKQAADPASNADSLTLVATIRESAEEAIKLTPAKAADVPEADRAKFVSDYQEKMKAFLAEVDNLATAFKENRNEDAVKLVAKLKTMQREGHRAFRRPQ